MRGAGTRGGSEVNETWGLGKKVWNVEVEGVVSLVFERWRDVEYEGVGCSVCGNEGVVKCEIEGKGRY